MTTIARLLHAAGVVALAGAIIAVFFLVLWIVGVLVDGRRLRRKAEEKREFVPIQVSLGNGPTVGVINVSKEMADDIAAESETKTWPGPEARA